MNASQPLISEMISNMETVKPGKALLHAINQRFIEEVGPIGDMLIEDAFNSWRLKQWRGPSAFRHYIRSLAENIENLVLRERFVRDAERFLLEAQSRQAAQHK